MPKEQPSKPIEQTHEQAAPPFDDPLWQPQDRTLLKSGFGRRALQERREWLFQNGWYDQDHPLQAYINDLAGRLPQLKNCRVIVTPYDNSSNACALPDGTIFITPKLITRAKSEEALLGILLHEWIHISREHARKKYAPEKDAEPEKHKVTSVLEGLSMGRLHEYTADIQGAVIELDRLGYNPLGYKEFLEDLARREGSGTSDLTHGASQERVLNITELLAVMHLPSTNKPLHPANVEVANWAKDKQGLHGFPALYASLVGKKRPAAQELMQERLAEISRIPLCLIPTALNHLWAELDELQKDAKTHGTTKAPHDCCLPPIEALSLRLARAVLPESDIQQDPANAGLAISAMYAENTPLPCKETAPSWHYARGELAFMRFKTTSLPAFLHTTEKLVQADLNQKHGLIISKTDLEVPYIDYLVSKFPALPTTEQDLDAWWAVVNPMARTICVNTAENKQATTELANGPWRDLPTSVSSLFRRWVLSITFSERVRPYVVEEKLYVTHPKVVEAHKRLFSRPQAPQKKDDRTLIVDKSQKEAATTKLEQINKQFFEPKSEALTREHLTDFVDRMMEQLMLLKNEADIFFAFTVLDFRGLFAIENLTLLLLQERLLHEHPAFASHPDIAKRLFLFHQAQEGLAIYEGYTRLLTHREKLNVDEKENIYLGNDQTIEASALRYLVEKTHTYLDYEGHLRQSDQGNLPAIAELLKNADRQGAKTRIICAVEACRRCSNLQEILTLLNVCEEQKILPDTWEKSVYTGPIVDIIVRELRSRSLHLLPFQERIRLMKFLRDASLRSEYADWLAADPTFQALGYADQVRYVVGDAKEKKLPGANTLHALSETKPVTQQDYMQGRAVVEQQLEELEATGSCSHGLMILIDQILPASQPDDALEFVRAAMLTQSDDRPLRAVILKKIWRHRQILDILKEHQTDYVTKQQLEELSEADESGAVEREMIIKRNQEIARDTVILANSILEELYRLQDTQKHVLIRKLLGGARGLLKDPVTKGKLLSALRETWIQKPGESSLLATVKQVEEALAEDTEWETLYLGLVGMMREQAFRRGETAAQASWDSVWTKKDLEQELGVTVDVSDLEPWQRPPKEARERPWRFPDQWMWYAEGKLMGTLRKKPSESSRHAERPRTPMGFVQTVASHSSAIGVRALQNIGQAVTLSPQEEQDLSAVYDQVKGQSRIAAIHYLERVWPNLWKEYRTIGARIGGGSIFTVIRGTTHAGEERVIKIVNPNITHALQQAGGLFHRTSERLAAKHGGAYRFVPGLIQDVRDSIDLEMNFRGFTQKDRTFSTQWNGYGEEGSPYRLRVPTSYGPEELGFLQEEFVEAKNLTRWKELEADGHDMKAVVRLLATTYLGQLMQGQALGDIHPGNEAVTAKKEVVLFDRTLYIEVKKAEQKLLTQLFTASSAQTRKEAVENYLSETFPDAQGLSGVLSAFQKAGRRADIRTSQHMLLALREAGLRPPLSLIFILKNLRALDGMAKKAGYKHGLVAAING